VNERKPLWPVASLIVLTGLNLLDYIDRWVLAAVFTPLKAELKLTDEQLGTLQSAFTWGYFLTAPIFGYLGDRVPRRWLIAAGVAVWSVGTLMSGHASALTSLMVFRVLVGFGEASFGTISPGWIADLFGRGRRNNAISVFYLAIPVGSALGYVIGGTIAAHYGWRAAFMWVGYPGLALAALLFLLREPPRGIADNGTEAAMPAAAGWRAYVQLLRTPRYVLVVAGYAAETFALGGFASWAPTFLYRVHHLSNEAANHFFGAAVAGTGLTATLIGGLLATRWQRRTGTGYEWVLVISAVAAAPAGFAAFLIPSLGWAKVALIGAMFLLFFATGPVNTLILETVPATMRATAMAGSIFAIHMFGDVWSPRLIGYLSDRWHDLQRAVLWVLPVSLVVSAVFWCWLLLRSRAERRLAATTG
jgi:MFS transporter, Spinster family, sphingosine-1-phosphate transporter